MSAQPVPRVVPVDGIPMSGLFAEAADASAPKAVVVALHGGASSAAYFDCPGHPDLSLLQACAARGFTAVALDRPGFGASGPYSDEMWEPSKRVDLAFGAVDKMLGARPRGAGLFVLAHSNGCELALRMVTSERGGEVLGVELAGTGLRKYPEAAALLSQATASYRPPGIRELIWAPAELYPDDVMGAVGSAASPPQEGGISTHWSDRDFPALAARVTVPVRFSAAEYEKVWDSTPAALADIAALFSASPRIEINEQRRTGHNLSLGYAAADYHAGVLAFVERCLSPVDANEEAR